MDDRQTARCMCMWGLMRFQAVGWPRGILPSGMAEDERQQHGVLDSADHEPKQSSDERRRRHSQAELVSSLSHADLGKLPQSLALKALTLTRVTTRDRMPTASCSGLTATPECPSLLSTATEYQACQKNRSRHSKPRKAALASAEKRIFLDSGHVIPSRSADLLSWGRAPTAALKWRRCPEPEPVVLKLFTSSIRLGSWDGCHATVQARVQAVESLGQLTCAPAPCPKSANRYNSLSPAELRIKTYRGSLGL